ncbi:glycoside hydrolase family 13 protein [Lapillicoccus sp.]|uniref:glycoside hydrolase family 13 protein n=1 Tax=Lapillicoccus sp. TaxID=1909287 RepID=UPI0025D53314|nr:glycoside hydrolase family 13 protein [Lapillicoccus sp.]
MCPRSWADGDGDGVGDLPGITAHLPYLRELGVDAVWLSPFYVSPQADAGYDVADYRDVDPVFGTLADADALIERAHGLGLKVIVDMVPNHSSDEHVWFQAALAAAPGSPQRARYLFRDGKGADGSLPPNNWISVFGGIAWTRVTEADGRPGQWYLHLFDRKQPDFDWSNPEVRAEFESVLRFWLDRGADGFRVDVAHGLVKDPALPDWDHRLEMLGDADADADPDADADADASEPEDRPHAPMFDQDGVHEIYEQWRRILNSYGAPDRILCAEAWVEPPVRAARYVRETEMHQAFNFDFLDARWDGPRLRTAITDSLAATGSVGAPTTWVLSNHDVVRHASRFGLEQDHRRPNGIGAKDRQPDRLVGLRRARAATALMLALPGAAYLYQGEELGLPDSTDMPDAFRQDPAFHRTGGGELGRDGCRVPMPWAKDAPAFGFGSTGGTWLPQPPIYGDYAVDQQEGVAGSTLELYRTLLAIRRQHRLGAGTFTWLEDYAGHPAYDEVVGFVTTGGDGARVGVVSNLGAEPVALPTGGRVLVASGDLTTEGRLPTDTTAWVLLTG